MFSWCPTALNSEGSQSLLGFDGPPSYHGTRKRHICQHLLWVLVVHDGEKFINCEHFGQGLSGDQFSCSLEVDHVAQGPVGVIDPVEPGAIWHPIDNFLFHPFAADVTGKIDARHCKSWDFDFKLSFDLF